MTRRYAHLVLACLAVLGPACGSDDPMDTLSGAEGGVVTGTPGGMTGGDASSGPGGSTGAPSVVDAGTGGTVPRLDAGATTPGGPGGVTGAGPSADSGPGSVSVDGGAGDASVPPSDAGMPPSAAGKLPRVTTTDGPGPFMGVVKVKTTPPGGWLIYPKDIGKDGIKHPLFIFGPGGGTTPDTYEQMGMHWDRYGSYGFVIYVLPRSTGDGAPMKAGLDWLIKQNDEASSPLYQKLDTTKICAAGHSQGSVTTFAFMPDDRVTTTIHISGGSFDGMGPSKLKKDTMFLCGPDEVATPQCDGDFANSKVPTYFTKIQGSTHLTSGRLGWPAIIAWMLWHLADQEDQWKKEFVDPTGKFHMGIYKSQVKNW